MPVTRRKWIPVETFDQYSKRFEEYFKMRRDENGIIEVRMHYDNGPVVWSYQMHHAIAELWTAIGKDRDNEVLIFTATGDKWIAQFDMGSFHSMDEQSTKEQYNVQIYDTQRIVENFLNDIDIPTITAFNGPGLHWEMGMLADITICTPDFVLRDDHYTTPPIGHVPGDGMYLAMQHLIGPKRANYFEYFHQEFTAQECVDLGIMNEVVERDKINDRAWELARSLLKTGRTCRRATHQLAVRPWQKLFTSDYKFHVAIEGYNKVLEKTRSGFEDTKKY
ncbi:MAG: enoyl-CoA hydratase/isomerase family protein [Parasporobacterium sp.]|nr:enoyl-CoA hydratase/isomerase family protein [Parasporobacterium sp.]